MKTRTFKMICFLLLAALFLSACDSILPAALNQDASGEVNAAAALPASSGLTDETDPTPTAVPDTPTPEATQPPPNTEPEVESEDNVGEEVEAEPTVKAPTPEIPNTVGPENFPEDINPLTGLPVEDPSLLELPPALISISNFPASARPQSGLNSSPITFEIAIGEGMTRFLAMFYGGFPKAVSGQTEGNLPGRTSTGAAEANGDEPESSDETGQGVETASIGPIRSGRLPYEDVRSLFSGFLVMASAWEGVAQDLSDTTSVFGSDGEDINSALVGVDKLQQIAQSQSQGYPGSNFNLEGLYFSQTPPAGGRTAHDVWVYYSLLNQIQWRYNEELGAYIRYDIKTDGSDEFVMATDRLSGEPVSKENVIVVYAEHDYIAPTLIDIDLINRAPTKALLFRDGQIHEIFWTTQFGAYEQETGLMRIMRFVDAEGNPIAMKHGQTWVHIVSTASYHRESVISNQPFHPIVEQPGSGLWLVRYKGKY